MQEKDSKLELMLIKKQGSKRKCRNYQGVRNKALYYKLTRRNRNREANIISDITWDIFYFNLFSIIFLCESSQVKSKGVVK